MIFLSDFLRTTVVDKQQKPLGGVRDILVSVQDPFPVVRALALRPHGAHAKVIDWGAVRMGEGHELSLNVTRPALKEYPGAKELLWLARDILDRQIVDTDGRRIVRVNDLQLQQRGGDLLVVGVDIGVRGLLRRIGMEGISRWILGLVRRDFPHRIVSWDAVDPVETDERSVRLKISHRKLSKLHPADIAEIVEQLGSKDRAAIFARLDDEMAADTLEESTEEVQAQILARLGDERAADILEAMSPDEAADLLAELPEERRRELLSKMEADESEDVEELLAYEEGTAGGLMTTDYVAFPLSTTVKDAIARLRKDAPEAQEIYHLFVIDARERLLGTLSLRDLIVAAPAQTLGAIMNERPVTVPLDMRDDDVAATMAKYNLLAVAVTDDSDCLQGIVTIDDALDTVMPQSVRRRARAL